MLSHPPVRQYPSISPSLWKRLPSHAAAQGRGQPRRTCHSPSASVTHPQLLQGQADPLSSTSVQRAEHILHITVTIQSEKSSGQQQGWVLRACPRVPTGIHPQRPGTAIAVHCEAPTETLRHLWVCTAVRNVASHSWKQEIQKTNCHRTPKNS